MKSQRPYLLRALYDWIVDNDETPYVLVDAQIAEVVVPQDHVQDGQIVLNMGPNAVRDLVMENDFVMFNSRFAGRAFEIILPMLSVKAIYCKDSGEGMVFPDEDLGSADSKTTDNPGPTPITTLEDLSPDAKRAELSDDSGGDDSPPTLRLV